MLYGDTYLRIDYAEAAHVWRESGLPGDDERASQRRSLGHLERSLRERAGAGLRQAGADRQRCSGSTMAWGASRSMPCRRSMSDESDLAELYQQLAVWGRLCGYEASERFYEIGTPAGLREADAFLRRCTRRAEPCDDRVALPFRSCSVHARSESRAGSMEHVRSCAPGRRRSPACWAKACASRCPEARWRSCTCGTTTVLAEVVGTGVPGGSGDRLLPRPRRPFHAAAVVRVDASRGVRAAAAAIRSAAIWWPPPCSMA